MVVHTRLSGRDGGLEVRGPVFLAGAGQEELGGEVLELVVAVFDGHVWRM